MFGESVNWLAILFAALSTMVVGTIWYNPRVFGSAWMAEIGKGPEDMDANPMMYIWTLAAAFVTAFVLAHIGSQLGIATLVDGLIFGSVAGAGLVATGFATHGIFHDYSFRHWLITAGHQVVNLAVMGAILGAWQ